MPGRRSGRGSPGARQVCTKNLVSLLVSQEPPAPLLADPTVYPAVNTRQEAELRAALLGLKGKSAADAAHVVYGLASAHAARREGPWAARGLAPSGSGGRTSRCAGVTPPLPADGPEALAEAYAEGGWKADWCALGALMATAPAPTLGALATAAEDRAAVVAALHALYLPRLEREANILQDLVSAGLPATRAPGEADTLLFVDGLRMDLAQQLATMLRAAGASVELEWRWSGFPSVTATSKPLASPAAGRFKGGAVDGFAPSTADGRSVGKAELLKELQALGWDANELLLATGKNWLEIGHIDHDGHQMQGRLAEQLLGMLQIIAAEVLRLVRAGRRVRVVTDHGWLLLPGGLPVAKLGSGLADTQWSRCATVKDGFRRSRASVPLELEQDGHSGDCPRRARVPGRDGVCAWRHQPAGMRRAGIDHRAVASGASSCDHRAELGRFACARACRWGRRSDGRSSAWQ